MEARFPACLADTLFKIKSVNYGQSLCLFSTSATVLDAMELIQLGSKTLSLLAARRRKKAGSDVMLDRMGASIF